MVSLNIGKNSVVFPALVVLLVCPHGVFTEETGRAKRAIGGAAIRRGRWPWLVLLRATIVTERLFGFPLHHRHLYCGGSLISPRWILTAAHCFTESGEEGRRPWNWEARMGTSRLRPSMSQRFLNLVGRVLDRDDMRQWEIDVDRIVLHPNYDPSDFVDHDLALVKLSSSVPRGFRMIQSVALPDETTADSFPVVGETCIAKGWGCTHRGGAPSDRARMVEMPVYPSWNCTYYFGLPNMDRKICAGYRNRGIGICEGDSGGPLVCQDEDEYKLVGVASFTSRDRPESFPAAFTRVADYLPWIRSVINND